MTRMRLRGAANRLRRIVQVIKGPALHLPFATLLLAIAFASRPGLAASSPARAAARPQAGLIAHANRSVAFEEVRIPNGDEPPLVAGIWYPTDDVARDVAINGAPQHVALKGSVAGAALPLVVLSHGGGGTYAGQYDTAQALARAGFVVAAVSHAGDTADDQSKVMMLWRRPAQLSRLIDYMLSGWRDHAAIDPHRIGAFGFSNGGFTVLVEVGGVPDLMKIDPYCAANPTHDLCKALAQAGVRSVAAIRPPAGAWRPDRRIRAIAAAAPAFGFTFDRAGLAAVDVPVLLWRAADDQHQPSPWYEEHLRDALPRPPEYHVEPLAGHYAFLPPCTSGLRSAAPAICTDAPGFDRAGFHERLNATLVRFFRTALGGPASGTAAKTRERAMKDVSGKFEVTITPEAQASEGGAPISRMGLVKIFAGALDGTARGTMITTGAPRPGSAASYVALDLFEGTLDGRKGGFVLIHRGTVTKAGEAALQVTIAPDSGTGALDGISGELTISVKNGQHLYDLRYSLPNEG